MSAIKSGSDIHTHVSEFDVDDGEEQVQRQKGGTSYDAQDMSRMGKRQQLQVSSGPSCPVPVASS
jgi:hypothetical protein